MSDKSQLRELARPFSRKYIQKAPKGKYGDYVSHSTVNERLLYAVGPFDFQLVEVVRGYAPEIKTQKTTYPARENAIVGVVARLTVEVDGRRVTVEEVGAEDSPAMKNDGDNLKTSMSDALKRCAMRLGLGLHLWSGDLYSLNEALGDEEEGEPEAPAPKAEPSFLRSQSAKPGPIRQDDIRKIGAALREARLDSDTARMVVESYFDRELVDGVKSLNEDEGADLAGWSVDDWLTRADVFRVPEVA